MNTDELSKYTDAAVELVMGYAPKVLLALLTLLIGLWLAGSIAELVRRGAVNRKLDATLTPFLVSLVSWGLRLAVFISAASIIGIQTTSFVAVLGAAGLAVGLALQGSLANFAGGALLLIFRPYKVGDLIEAQGKLGVVEEIQIFTTTLLSPESRLVILPNGPVSNGTIVNYSRSGKLRVDLVVGIAYQSDIEQARAVLLKMMESDPRIMKDPAPMVEVLELADSSVNLAVRPHCTVDNYWAVYFETLKKSKLTLDAAGISIPFPQRDVHLIQQTPGA